MIFLCFLKTFSSPFKRTNNSFELLGASVNTNFSVVSLAFNFGFRIGKKDFRKIFGVFALLLLIVIGMPLHILRALPDEKVNTTLHTSGNKILDANNNPIYLKGIGRLGDLDSLNGQWYGIGETYNTNDFKFVTDKNLLNLRINQTLDCYKNVWQVNNIRVFIAVDWWYQDSVNPSIYDNNFPNRTFSYRDYIETVITLAQDRGIYVNFVPYNVFNFYEQTDPQYEGVPLFHYDRPEEWITKINPNQTSFWIDWWGSVVDRIGSYQNVMFEAWNEPEINDVARDPQRWIYYNYLWAVYKTIRIEKNNSNIIFLQYYMNTAPNWKDLSWMQEVYGIISAKLNDEPTNLVFTTHIYRHTPDGFLEPQHRWAYSYDQLKSQIETLLKTGMDNIPIVFNEIGIMTEYKYAATGDDTWVNELSFWRNLLTIAKEKQIGVTAYYWMGTEIWGSRNQALLASNTWKQETPSPMPNQVGQYFIDVFKDESTSTPALPPAPTPVPVDALTIRPQESVRPTTPSPGPTPLVRETFRYESGSFLLYFVIIFPSVFFVGAVYRCYRRRNRI